MRAQLQSWMKHFGFVSKTDLVKNVFPCSNWTLLNCFILKWKEFPIEKWEAMPIHLQGFFIFIFIFFISPPRKKKTPKNSQGKVEKLKRTAEKWVHLPFMFKKHFHFEG